MMMILLFSSFMIGRRLFSATMIPEDFHLERIADKNTVIGELRERLTDKEARVLAAERELRERLTEHRERLNDKERLLEAQQQMHVKEVARLNCALDVSKSRYDARGLLEACIEDAWRKRASSRQGLCLLTPPLIFCRKKSETPHHLSLFDHII
jgi:hypothetical protein